MTGRASFDGLIKLRAQGMTAGSKLRLKLGAKGRKTGSKMGLKLRAKGLKARSKFIATLQNCNLIVDAIDARTRECIESTKLRLDDDDSNDECSMDSGASGSEQASSADSREGGSGLRD